MAFGYTRKLRGDVFDYTRPNKIIDYTPSGEVVYEPNELRLGYDSEWNRDLGVVFGDGGSATIPPAPNPHYVDDPSPVTVFVIGQAPVGVTWFRWGDVEIEGLGGHKLHIIELPDASTLGERVDIFPNKENIEDPCHFMLVKYYNEINIPLGEEGEAMDELNTFVNGAWN